MTGNMTGFTAACVLAAGITASVHAQPVYRVTDLGVISNGTTSAALAVNDKGQVTGYSTGQPSAGTYGFLSHAGSPMQDVGSLPYTGWPTTVGRAINTAGQIVGESRRDDPAGGVTHAFLYTGGTMTDLGTLPDQKYSVATGINTAGQLVGYASNVGPFQDTATRAFVYVDGTMTDLKTLGGTSASASAVNDAGQITGTSQTGAGYNHAFLFQKGVMQDLGTIAQPPGSTAPPGEGTVSIGRAINAGGVVAGSSQLKAGSSVVHAAVFGGGTVTDLGTLGGESSDAMAINALGVVVGTSQVGAPGSTGQSEHAFLFDGTMRDLNRLLDGSGAGWTLQYAYDISGSGYIVGQGVNPTGESHAFLLTPVPEPGSLALAGGIGVAAMIWRRRPGRRGGSSAPVELQGTTLNAPLA